MLVVDNNQERYQQRSEDTEKGQKIPTKVRKVKEKNLQMSYDIEKVQEKNWRRLEDTKKGQKQETRLEDTAERSKAADKGQRQPTKVRRYREKSRKGVIEGIRLHANKKTFIVIWFDKILETCLSSSPCHGRQPG